MLACAPMATRARRVFVIDDDHSVRGGLARLLVAAGYPVETFESGPAFLERSQGRTVARGRECAVPVTSTILQN